MKVRYTPRAFHDREQILNYLRARSVSGALKVETRLDAAIRLLTEHPLAGTPTDLEGVRVLFVGRYPYKIFYRVRVDAVEILVLRHTAREPSDME